MDLTIILIIIGFVLMLIGLMGVVLPYLWGVPIAWIGMLIYAWGTDFERISITTLLVFLALSILAIVLDALAPILGARKYNASKYGVWGAMLGTLLGIAFAGPVGVILGPLFGAFLGELILAKKEGEAALKASLGTVVGFLVGVFLKLVLVLVMIGFMIASLF